MERSKTYMKELEERYLATCTLIRNATKNKYKPETPEEQANRISMLLLPENFQKFDAYYLDPIAPLANYHIKAAKEYLNKDAINFFWKVYRGGAKSTVANTAFLLNLKFTNKTKFHVQIGANQDLAIEQLLNLQAHLESNELLIRDFGLQKVFGNVWRDEEFETKDGFHAKALGIDQPFRGLNKFGKRLDSAHLDDLDDREKALNPRLVRKYGEKIIGDLMKAFGRDHKRLAVLNNYFTRTGLVQYLIDQLGNYDRTVIHTVNALNRNNKSSWPQYYSTEYFLNEKANTPYIFWEREMMNNPVEAGKVFKHEWIAYKLVQRHNKYDSIVGYWDLSYKATGDYKAFWLVGRKGRELHILDVFCRKCDLPDCAEWMYDLDERLQAKGIYPQYWYEGSFAQDDLYKPVFDAEAEKRGWFCNIQPDRRAKGDKFMRIESTLTTPFHRNQIYFNEKLKGGKDLKDALDQLLAFEKGSKANDDSPDALEGAVYKLLRDARLSTQLTSGMVKLGRNNSKNAF